MTDDHNGTVDEPPYVKQRTKKELRSQIEKEYEAQIHKEN